MHAKHPSFSSFLLLTSLLNLLFTRHAFFFLVSSFLSGSSALENRQEIDKFPDEDAILARYEIHMKMRGPLKDARNFRHFLESPIAKEHPMVSNMALGLHG